MTVAENIKKIRKEKGLTQKQLGEKCKMSESTLRQYELGFRNPKLQTLAKIAAALDVSANDLLESPLDGTPLYEVFKDVSISDSPEGRRYINAELTIQVDDWQQIDIELVKTFKKLNEAGKTKAIERISELTEIPRYTQKEKNQPDKEE